MATFGNQTIGGTAGSISTGGALWAFKFTSPADFGTLTALSIYVSAGVTGETCYVCMYADAAGKPGALLADGPIVPASAAGWKTASGLNYAGDPATPYWLAFFDPAGNGSKTIYEAAGGSRYVAADAVATPPDPAPAGGSSAAWTASVYATYTPTASGIFVPRILHYG